MINIYDDKYAEPIFWFIDEHFDDYCEYQALHIEDISMCEYIQRERYQEFCSWCKEWYPNL